MSSRHDKPDVQKNKTIFMYPGLVVYGGYIWEKKEVV